MKFNFVFKGWVRPLLVFIMLLVFSVILYFIATGLFINGKVNFLAVLNIIASACVIYFMVKLFKKDSFYCEIKDDILFVKISSTLVRNKISNLCFLKKTNKGFVIFKSHRIIVCGDKVQFPVYPEDGDKFIEELLKINPNIKLT